MTTMSNLISARAKARRRRSAFSLMELLAVVVLLSVLVGLGIAMRPHTLNIPGAKTDARRLAFDLLQARQRAIFTGDNHLLVFSSSGGSITGYTVHRRTGVSTTTAVEQAKTFNTGIVVTRSPSSDPEFTFEGGTLAGQTFTLTAGTHAWTVTVIQVTGAVSVSGS